jgi:hypothetical protein
MLVIAICASLCDMDNCGQSHPLTEDMPLWISPNPLASATSLSPNSGSKYRRRVAKVMLAARILDRYVTHGLFEKPHDLFLRANSFFMHAPRLAAEFIDFIMALIWGAGQSDGSSPIVSSEQGAAFSMRRNCQNNADWLEEEKLRGVQPCL